MDPVCRGINRDRSACDDKIIVCLDAVFVSGIDLQRSASVDRQIVVRKDHTVGPVFEGFLRQFLPAGEGIGRSLRQRQEYLVRLIHAQAGVITAGDIDPV